MPLSICIEQDDDGYSTDDSCVSVEYSHYDAALLHEQPQPCAGWGSAFRGPAQAGCVLEELDAAMAHFFRYLNLPRELPPSASVPTALSAQRRWAYELATMMATATGDPLGNAAAEWDRQFSCAGVKFATEVSL